MISISDVSKVYNMGGGKKVTALDHVDLSLAKGSFTVVLGASGCGKSTLLMAMGGLLRPTSGSVNVQGQDLYALSGSARARFRATKIGFVFQNFHLVPYLSGIENVLLPVLAEANAGDAPKARALELLEQFGLGGRVDHCPEEMSTGERQRVALARALLNKPELLLADEPTGNLDPDNGKAVLEYIRTFHASGGTVVLVTHDHSLSKYADRILRFEEGRLLSEGAAQASAGLGQKSEVGVD